MPNHRDQTCAPALQGLKLNGPGTSEALMVFEVFVPENIPAYPTICYQTPPFICHEERPGKSSSRNILHALSEALDFKSVHLGWVCPLERSIH